LDIWTDIANGCQQVSISTANNNFRRFFRRLTIRGLHRLRRILRHKYAGIFATYRPREVVVGHTSVELIRDLLGMTEPSRAEVTGELVGQFRRPPEVGLEPEVGPVTLRGRAGDVTPGIPSARRNRPMDHHSYRE